MKTKALVCMMLILLLSSLTGAFSGASKEKVVLPNVLRITAEDLKKMIDKGAGDFVIVDVRDSGSYDAGHIKGAINIYYDATSDPTELKMTLQNLPMEKLIVTYCDCMDDASSANVAQELYMLGFDRDKLKALAGGSLRWVELKYPMVASNK
jgi:rhodanese-related sulfurtransferase